MPYTPDPVVVTEPQDIGVQASTAAAEFRAIKLYMRDVLLVNDAARLVKNASGGADLVANARLGYIAQTDVATVAGIATANYGITYGSNYAGFSGPGLGVSGYYGILFATAGIERLRIGQNGNIVQGAASSGNSYSIEGTANGPVTARIISTSNGNAAYARVQLASDVASVLLDVYNSSGVPGGAGQSWLYTSTNTPLVLGTNNLNRVMVANTGEVGVNKTPLAGVKLLINSTLAGEQPVILDQVDETGAIPVLSTRNANASLATQFALYHQAADVYLGNQRAGELLFRTGGSARVALANSGTFYPVLNNSYALGSSTNRWSNVYGVSGDFSGTVTASNFVGPATTLASSNPCVCVTDGGTQTRNSSTWSVMNGFTTEVVDAGANFNGSSTFTAPVAGVYEARFTCTVTDDGTANVAQARFYVNGVAYTQFPAISHYSPTVSAQIGMAFGGCLSLAPADTVEVWARRFSGTGDVYFERGTLTIRKIQN